MVIVWDGMRPDHIGPEITPNLCTLIAGGCQFKEARATFPPVTRPSAATLSTGTHPGHHGIHGNTLPGPSEASGVIDGITRAELERLRISNGGRILRTQTLAEVLAAAGKRMLIVSSCSAGTSTLLDPERVAATINAGFIHPASLGQTVQERFGCAPAKSTPAHALDDWLVDVMTELVLAQDETDVVVGWFCEPDNTQHIAGIGSPAALDAIRGNDARLGRIVEAVERSAKRTALIVISDHGHSTISSPVDVASAVADGGFRTELKRGWLVYTGIPSQLSVRGGGDDLVKRVVTWLDAQPWIDVVVSWHPAAPELTPSMLLATRLWDDRGTLDGPTSPTFTLLPTWDAEVNEFGVQGRQVAAPTARPYEQWRAWHGTLSPHDLRTMLVLRGPGIRPGRPPSPAGIIDVAPTVLALLGQPAGTSMDGRVLTEALESTEPPPPLRMAREPLRRLDAGSLYRLWVNETAYLDVHPTENEEKT